MEPTQELNQEYGSLLIWRAARLECSLDKDAPRLQWELKTHTVVDWHSSRLHFRGRSRLRSVDRIRTRFVVDSTRIQLQFLLVIVGYEFSVS